MPSIIELAYATEQSQSQSAIVSFLPFILITVVFYLLLIRPQQKKAKQHQQMVNNIAKGDTVTTTGGIIGRVCDVEQNIVSIEISNGVLVKFKKESIGEVQLKSTSDIKGVEAKPKTVLNNKKHKNDKLSKK